MFLHLTHKHFIPLKLSLCHTQLDMTDFYDDFDDECSESDSESQNGDGEDSGNAE